MRRTDVTHSARLSGHVLRYHTWPTLTTQTIADHSFHVLRIYVQLFGPPSPEVTVAILQHDLPEIATGDPPFPVKADNPDLKAGYDRLEPQALDDLGMEQPELTDEERHKIKMCDLLEMTEFGSFEMTLGNQFAEPVIRDTVQSAKDLARKHGLMQGFKRWNHRETDRWRGR